MRVKKKRRSWVRGATFLVPAGGVFADLAEDSVDIELVSLPEVGD